MSHEIRTPLNTILCSTELIKEETENKLDKEIKSFFPIISLAGKRLIKTIDSILNMSELQTGSYEVEIKEIDVVDEILKYLVQEFRYAAGNKNIIIRETIESNDNKINADQYSVEQIFTNLLDNAIKYTDKGEIQIRVYRDQENKLSIDLKDTGIGIDNAFIPDLFEAFRQEYHGYSRKFEGNGLGLSLVKKYCELNNAHIKVKSEKGVGSIFTVTFNSKLKAASI
jgi:signal transduction histidine kinase